MQRGFSQTPKPNPALNLAPFGRWTLRDQAAPAGEFKRQGFLLTSASRYIQCIYD